MESGATLPPGWQKRDLGCSSTGETRSGSKTPWSKSGRRCLGRIWKASRRTLHRSQMCGGWGKRCRQSVTSLTCSSITQARVLCQPIRVSGWSLTQACAGVFEQSMKKTVDGNEFVFQVNVLAPFLLTSVLLETVSKATNPRIIIVSSISQGELSTADWFEDPVLHAAKAWDLKQVLDREPDRLRQLADGERVQRPRVRASPRCL